MELSFPSVGGEGEWERISTYGIFRAGDFIQSVLSDTFVTRNYYKVFLLHFFDIFFIYD